MIAYSEIINKMFNNYDILIIVCVVGLPIVGFKIIDP